MGRNNVNQKYVFFIVYGRGNGKRQVENCGNRKGYSLSCASHLLSMYAC